MSVSGAIHLVAAELNVCTAAGARISERQKECIYACCIIKIQQQSISDCDEHAAVVTFAHYHYAMLSLELLVTEHLALGLLASHRCRVFGFTIRSDFMATNDINTFSITRYCCL